MTALLTISISPFIYGFVFSKLWLWFIVPTFQMHPLSVVEAIGIIFFANFMKAKENKEVDNDKVWKTCLNKLRFAIFLALFSLSTGWVIQLFL